MKQENSVAKLGISGLQAGEDVKFMSQESFLVTFGRGFGSKGP